MAATADLGFVPDASAPGLGFIPDKPTPQVDLGFVPDKNPGGLSDTELQRVLALVPHTAKPAPDDLLVPDIQRDNARQVALDQPFAAIGPGGKIFQETPQNNPEANGAEFAKLWQVPSDVTRAGLTDAVTTALLPVTYPLYGVQGVAGMESSLPSAFKNAFRNTETNPGPEPLPVDAENSQMSGEHPILATISKVGQSAAGALPLAAASAVPAWAGRLMALGFTSQMIADAGPAAQTLGTELGKNPEDRDNDQMTSAAASLVQDFGFAPFVGLHGTRDIVERYADKPMYAIRQLSDQLQNAPIVRPAATANQSRPVGANALDVLPSRAAETPTVKISQDLAGAIQEALRGNQIARAVPQTFGQKMLDELRQQASTSPIIRANVEPATPVSKPLSIEPTHATSTDEPPQPMHEDKIPPELATSNRPVFDPSGGKSNLPVLYGNGIEGKAGGELPSRQKPSSSSAGSTSDKQALPNTITPKNDVKQPGSNVTRLGIKRTNPAHWRATRDLWDRVGYSEILSDANRAAIARGKTPVVDEAWIRYFPEDAGLAGELIPMHHIGGSPITVPLPVTRHLSGHMPGGYRYNSGGPGSALPAYPAVPRRQK